MALHWTLVAALGVCSLGWACEDELGSHSCTDVGCVGGISLRIQSDDAWPAGSYRLVLEQPGWARECEFELPLEERSDGRTAAAELRCTPALELAVAQDSACRQTSAPMIGNCVPVPNHYHVEGFITDELTGDLSVRLERAGVTLVDESRPLSYTEFRPNGPECGPVCEGSNLDVVLPSE